MRYEYDLQQPGFTVGNITIVNSVREKNYRHSYRNGRARHGFVYVARGTMTDIFSGEFAGEMYLKEGDLLFAPKGSKYIGIYTEDNTEVKVIQFDIINGELPAYLSKPVKIDLPQAKDSLNAFFVPQGVSSTRHPFYYLSCLYHLLWQIDSLYSDIPHKYKRLKNALDDMAENYFRNESIAYYAKLCDMSEVNFRRLFREYKGVSPIAYRNDLRLGSAQAMLQSGEYNVSEVAEACGFSNLSFFIRLYKKKFGYTPKKE